MRPPLEVTVSTSGPMNNYNKQAAVEFVDERGENRLIDEVPLVVQGGVHTRTSGQMLIDGDFLGVQVGLSG